MSQTTADAVVIGSGPNGLVAANAVADAGWDDSGWTWLVEQPTAQHESVGTKIQIEDDRRRCGERREGRWSPLDPDAF